MYKIHPGGHATQYFTKHELGIGLNCHEDAEFNTKEEAEEAIEKGLNEYYWADCKILQQNTRFQRTSPPYDMSIV